MTAIARLYEKMPWFIKWLYKSEFIEATIDEKQQRINDFRDGMQAEFNVIHKVATNQNK